MRRRWAASRPRACGAHWPRRLGALLAGGACWSRCSRCWADALAGRHRRATALAPAERAAILALGPWPPAHDPRRRQSGLGPARRASRSARRCSTARACRRAACAAPAATSRGVTSPTAAWSPQGAAAGSRNTSSLLDAARHRHFGWDGAHDAAVAAEPAAAGRCARDARRARRRSRRWCAATRGCPRATSAVFGMRCRARTTQRVTREVGLALAAYVETLASPRAPFDDWRDRLASARPARASRPRPMHPARSPPPRAAGCGCSSAAPAARPATRVRCSATTPCTCRWSIRSAASGLPDAGHPWRARQRASARRGCAMSPRPRPTSMTAARRPCATPCSGTPPIPALNRRC